MKTRDRLGLQSGPKSDAPVLTRDNFDKIVYTNFNHFSLLQQEMYDA